MSPTEKPAFVAILIKSFRMSGKDITGDPETVADWLDEFSDYPITALDSAFRRHRRESVYPPKPADIYRYLDGQQAADGRPSADEAWGLLLRLVRDERETGALTDEMRAGWQGCQPILDEGDEVGARRCFIAVYETHVRDARQRREPARWTPTLGTCPQLRAQRLAESVNAGRLSRDHVAGLLAGPTPNSIEQVAGLLEGPDAPRGAFDAAASLRGLSAMLRKSMTDDESERAAARERRKAAEDAERQRQIEIAEREAANRRGEQAA